MKVYRRPRLSGSRRADNDPIAYVNHEDLQQKLTANRRITFRIDRNAHKRIPLGGIEFENSDLFALLEGSTSRLRDEYKRLNEALQSIRKTIDNMELDEKKKLREIQWVVLRNTLNL